MSAPLPSPTETARLASLRAIELLDTQPEERFDLFTRLACALAQTPIAAISLVDEERQWFKSIQGLCVRQTPREQSFCSHAIETPDRILVVRDASLDPRWRANPLVTGEPGIRFYAGVPVLLPDRQPAGALCVIDRVARDPSEALLAQLQDLALGVSSVFALQRAVTTLQRGEEADPLTRLANRGTLERRLGVLAATGREAVLLGIDLLRFRVVNELFGHRAGDLVLVEAARRIREVVRPVDLAARMQEDEFSVLIEGVGDQVVAGDIVRRVHGVLTEPFWIDGQQMALGATIGAVRIGPGSNDPVAALRLADAALFQAKSKGRGTVHLWPGSAAGGADAAEGRHSIEARLRDALIPEGREPFSLAWQPVVDPRDRSTIGFEALVRWPRAGRAPLMPGQFIPVAEATGLICRLDRFVLRSACREAASWQVPLRISVNFSGASMQLLDVVDTVQQALAESGLPAERLVVEVTETVLVHDAAAVKATIDQLRAIGVRVALDDFGSGHASLASLRDFRFDVAKIDRAFVSRLGEAPEARALIRSMVQILVAMGIAPVAEGVETEQELAILREEGVNAVQGYLLGVPGALPALVRTPGRAA